MPTASLPARPSLEHLRNRAKDLLKSYRAGRTPALVRFREALPRLSAMPDDRLGERACVFVTLRPDAEALTFEAMCGFLLERRLAKPYLPERLELIDAMPRTASGKIQKFRLRELAADLRPMRG